MYISYEFTLNKEKITWGLIAGWKEVSYFFISFFIKSYFPSWMLSTLSRNGLLWDFVLAYSEMLGFLLSSFSSSIMEFTFILSFFSWSFFPSSRSLCYTLLSYFFLFIFSTLMSLIILIWWYSLFYLLVSLYNLWIKFYVYFFVNSLLF